MAEIIGRHRIPKELIGADKGKILDWARTILRGQEPKLEKDDFSAIRDGKVAEIFLEPKVSGTYLPDGEFIPAFEYAPPIGGDLEEAECKWKQEEEANIWADEENRLFNKISQEESKEQILQLWEHGKRIMAFCAQSGYSPEAARALLARRGGAKSYALMMHEMCVVFYRWKPNIAESDMALTLNWKRLAHVITFAKSNDSIKDHVLAYIVAPPLNELSSSDLQMLLQGDLDKNPQMALLTEEERREIVVLRSKLKSCADLDTSETLAAVEIIRKKRVILARKRNGSSADRPNQTT